MARSPAAREDVAVNAGSSDARYYSSALHRPLSYRWVMLGLDALLYFSFGLASSSMAALSVAIGADLHLSPAQLGTVLGSWQAVYVLCALASGLVLDRFGLRRTMTVGALFIGLSAYARSFAVDFPTLLIAVALFGVGGPMMSVGSNKVVSEWFAEAERGPALGIAIGAPTLGSVAVLALGNSVLIPVLGSWRAALLACGVVSALAAVAWTLFAREAPRHQAAAGPRVPREAVGASVSHLLRLPNVRLILASSIGVFMMSHGIVNWLPSLLVARAFTPTEAGIWIAVSTAIGLPAGMLVPRLVQPGARRLPVAVLGLLSAAAVLGITFSTGIPLLMALVVFGVARAGISPLMMLVLMDMREIGAARTGAAAGLYFTFGEAGGFGGPFLIGVLSGAGGDYALPLVLLAAIQVLIALSALRLREAPRR